MERADGSCEVLCAGSTFVEAGEIAFDTLFLATTCGVQVDAKDRGNRGKRRGATAWALMVLLLGAGTELGRGDAAVPALLDAPDEFGRDWLRSDTAIDPADALAIDIVEGDEDSVAVDEWDVEW